MKFRLLHLAAGAAVALSASGATWAHGEAHVSRQKATLTAPEQKPWGIAVDPKAVSRTIEVRMTDDMRFTPERITVREGESVRLVVRNEGQMLHEMVIGSKRALDEHAAMMLRFPEMEHDEAYMTHVNPGKDGRIEWNFNRPGEFQFACLIAGHYQAGMVGTISVTPARKSTERK